MTDKTQSIGSHDQIGGDQENIDLTKYDRSSLSYASTFANPWKSRFISLMELFTGKLKILRMVRDFERRGAPQGQAFWRAALDAMGIDLTTPQSQLDLIPKPCTAQGVVHKGQPLDHRHADVVGEFKRGSTRAAFGAVDDDKVGRRNNRL